ncbi:extracellular solute-binding protein [candidate division KSB3 bacterium]|uniref:Extracellular solute-binding protein n=1 Tax=candidate division KSB3 bacterium TaxID=2044937 RepID=A0A9D5Q5J4_9BACT|nr:extracellular solute-binding protein [candidate division KSB3 bacterium]MBD3324690.1 extracellular solute-binding protein [candidate division KSB3 bacterium]
MRSRSSERDDSTIQRRLVVMKGKIVVFMLLLMLPLAVQAQETVVLYSAHNQEIVDVLLPEFEAATGIDAEVIRLGSGDVVARVKAEQNNPQCDVIWSIGGEQLEANADLLESYTPQEWDKIAEVFKVGTNWLPYTGIVMVFVVNTDMLTEEEMPKAWTDLSDPRFKDLISSARADKSGSSYMQLATVLNIYPEKGWEVYKGILANFVLSGSSSAVPRFVNDGEAAVGITLEDNAYRYVQGGGPVKIVYPEDGTTAAPDGIALVKDAPHPDAAKQFIDWALSKETQDLLVQEMGRRPVRVDGAVPPELPPLDSIKTVPYDFAWSAANKDEFVAKWTELVQELGL